MALFFQFLALLFGIAAISFGRTKGYFLNLAIVILILLFNSKMFHLKRIVVIITLSLFIYFLAIYITALVNKKYEQLPIRDMAFGGATLSLLFGMVLRPILSGAVFTPVLIVPLLRRYIKLGIKALLFTFSGYLLRLLYSLTLNVYIIIQLLKQ